MNNNLKSLSVHIGIFGRTNVGKSTLINYISGQETSIVSNISGTTTDTVYKKMELSPIGPVTLIDTAGIDDTSNLSEQRINKTEKIFDICDIAIIVLEPNVWTKYEDNIVSTLSNSKTNFVLFINNYKKEILSSDFFNKIKNYKNIESQLLNEKNYRDNFINELKKLLLNIIPEETLNLTPLTNNEYISFLNFLIILLSTSLYFSNVFTQFQLRL